jgi:hypothetical protein
MANQAAKLHNFKYVTYISTLRHRVHIQKETSARQISLNTVIPHMMLNNTFKLRFQELAVSFAQYYEGRSL